MVCDLDTLNRGTSTTLTKKNLHLPRDHSLNGCICPAPALRYMRINSYLLPCANIYTLLHCCLYCDTSHIPVYPHLELGVHEFDPPFLLNLVRCGMRHGQ